MNGRKLEILALPYRDYWYSLKYGDSVRDLAMLRVLANHPQVASVVSLCRPRVLFEPRDFARASRKEVVRNLIRWQISRSFELLGPLRRRAWTEHAYGSVLVQCLQKLKASRSEVIRVFLDFHPIALVNQFPEEIWKNGFYWYDLIDNFKKHNRYCDNDLRLVDQKYKIVRKQARLVTGVTMGAIDEIGCENYLVVPNCQYEKELRVNTIYTGEFEFGFLGFISNKFDIEFVRQIAAQGYRVIIAGEVLDAAVGEELNKLAGVTLTGKFHQNQIEKIVSRFAIGIVPYRGTLSHDGSPLKAYQYLSNGRAVIANMVYELSGEWVGVSQHFSDDVIQDLVKRSISLINISFEDYANQVFASYPKGATWELRVDTVLKKIIEISDETSN